MTTGKRPSGEGSIYSRGTGYAAYTWITTPAGRRQRKYVYGRSREEVHAKWIELTRLAQRNPVMAPMSPKLGQFLHTWLNQFVEPNLAPLTAATYETLVRLYIEPGLGQKRLDRLRVSDVQVWLNQLARQCQCCAQGKDAKRAARRASLARCCAKGECCGQTLSARTIRDLRTVLRSALSAAIRDELVDKNVAALARPPRVRQHRVTPWTSDEARAFLETARDHDPALYAAYVLILILGLRKGEVLGLTWDAIDSDREEILIDQQLQRVRRALLLRETKTEASNASLPLPKICADALRARRVLQDQDRDDVGVAWRGPGTGRELVFTGKYGTPIDPRTLNRRFSAQLRIAGVRPIRVHDARKTCATLLVDLDVHPRIIMRVLRHADISVTMEIYAKASSAQTRDALRRLGESLG